MDAVGIVQSRGLGDIVIALPIAWHHYQQGSKVYWPICQPFIASMKSAAPWVHWIPIPVDPQGKFFADEPLKRLKNFGVKEENILWLYQYLSSTPEKTNMNWFSMMKFDQYKYAAAGLPFRLKWTLNSCITRDQAREQHLFNRLVKNSRYWVVHQKGSNFNYDIDTSAIDAECQIIEINEITNNIWDWLLILEKCEGMIMIDSVFANIVDQLDLNPSADRYFMRRWNQGLDGVPVFNNEWTYVDVETPSGYQFRQINPAEEAKNRLRNS